MNLIGNAIKHHHRKPEGRIVVSAEDAGAWWRFRVSDDGPGIAPRFHEKIFVIFQTLEARDKVEGTGIGLALVKKIVESFGGTITVDSDVGRGATFEFTWPK
jgi:signal transduction histidine kinase